MALSARVPLRVQHDFAPTTREFAGEKVLTIVPYAFAPQRDLVYLALTGDNPVDLDRWEWGLVADLANLLQARTHIFCIPPSMVIVPVVYNRLVRSWAERLGAIVLAGYDEAGEIIREMMDDHASYPLIPKPDYVVRLPWYMRYALLPVTGRAKRQISKQIWGDE